MRSAVTLGKPWNQRLAPELVCRNVRSVHEHRVEKNRGRRAMMPEPCVRGECHKTLGRFNSEQYRFHTCRPKKQIFWEAITAPMDRPPIVRLLAHACWAPVCLRRCWHPPGTALRRGHEDGGCWFVCVKGNGGVGIPWSGTAGRRVCRIDKATAATSCVRPSRRSQRVDCRSCLRAGRKLAAFSPAAATCAYEGSMAAPTCIWR